MSSRALEKNQIVNTERNGIYEIFIVAKSTENSIPFNNSYLLDKGIIIDALVGSGLTGAVRGDIQEIIKFVNQQGAPVISIDLPSGIVANTGHIPSVAVKADLTVCLIALKPGLLSGKAKEYLGELVVDNLGIDLCGYPNISTFGQVLDIDQAIENLPKGRANVLKYDAGLCVIVGGDFGMMKSIRDFFSEV